MSKSLEDIENEVSQFSPEQLKKFREWFIKFDFEIWDQQIQDDVANERLNSLAEEALEDHRANRTKQL